MIMHSTEIADGDRLAALEPHWWALWHRCPAATPFQTPAWLVAWWRAFAPGRLCTVAVWQGERLVGLAPLYRDGSRLLPLGISVSDYLDVLLDPACSDAAASALVDHVHRLQEWRSWELPDLTPGAAALGLACPAACRECRDPQNLCLVRPLPDSVETLWQHIPSRTRRDVRQARNRAARRGPVAVERLDTHDPAAAFERLVHLHQARWRSRGEAGVLADARVRRLHASALGPLAARGLVRLYGLSIAGRIASIYYGFCHANRAYAYLSGLDPDFAFESPGTLLLWEVLEASVKEGMREFHFLRGDETYKRAWNPTERFTLRRVIEREPASFSSEF